jgi:hypothetical protein
MKQCIRLIIKNVVHGCTKGIKCSAVFVMAQSVYSSIFVSQGTLEFKDRDWQTPFQENTVILVDFLPISVISRNRAPKNVYGSDTVDKKLAANN